MELFALIIFIILIVLFIFVNKLNDEGMLTKAQYRFYIIIIFMALFLLCGLLNTITNTNY